MTRRPFPIPFMRRRPRRSKRCRAVVSCVPVSTSEGAGGGGRFGRGGFAEDEDFYKEDDEDDDGELAKEEGGEG